MHRSSDNRNGPKNAKNYRQAAVLSDDQFIKFNFIGLGSFASISLCPQCINKVKRGMLESGDTVCKDTPICIDATARRRFCSVG